MSETNDTNVSLEHISIILVLSITSSWIFITITFRLIGESNIIYDFSQIINSIEYSLTPIKEIMVFIFIILLLTIPVYIWLEGKITQFIIIKIRNWLSTVRETEWPYNKSLQSVEKLSVNNVGGEERDLMKEIIDILILSSITVAVITIRYLFFMAPQGYDTMSYIFIAELLAQRPEKYILKVTHPVSNIIALILLEITGGDLIKTAIALPYVVGSLSTILMYYATRKSLGRNMAIVTTSIYPLTYAFIRLSYDLYGQLLAVPMIILIIAQTLNDDREVRSKTILYLVLLFLTHTPTFIIFLPYLFLIKVNQIFGKKKIERQILADKKTLILASILSIPVVLYIGFKASAYMSLLSRISKEINPLSSPLNPKFLWPLIKESLTTIILATLSLVLLTMEKNYVKRNFLMRVILWYGYLLFVFIIILGYEQAYRVTLYTPLPILISYVLEKISQIDANVLGNITGMKKIQSRLLLNILVVFLLLNITLNATANAHIQEYHFYDQSIYEKLERVRDIFGFNNKTIVVVIHRELYKETSLYLAYAIIGENVFFGTIGQYINATKYSSDLPKYIVLVRGLFNPWTELKYVTYSKSINPDILIIPTKYVLINHMMGAA